MFQYEPPEPNVPHRRTFLFAAIGAAVIGMVAIAAVLVSSDARLAGISGFTAKPCKTTSAQAEFQCSVIQDRSALIPGTVAVLRRITIPLGQTDEFEVTVCGARSTHCDKPATTPEASRVQGSSDAGQVLVGGYISAKLTSDMPGQIDMQSEQVQPIITDTDAATWMWEIDPSRAGTFPLTLMVTPLRGTSETALVAGVPYAIRLTVTESTGQHLTSAVGWGSTFVKHLADVLGALGLGTVAAMITWFWKRVQKRKKANAEPSADSPSSTEAHADAGLAPAPVRRPSRPRRSSNAPRDRRPRQLRR